MINNTPTLTQSEEEIAPYNEKTKIISVFISQTLSTEVKIEIPENLEDYDQSILISYVENQIMLPNEVVRDYCSEFWNLDDFCVTYDKEE